MLASLRGMPGVTVDLMWGEVAGKDPFYAGITKAYYAATRKRHPKFPLIRVDQYGVALVQLPKKFDEYFMMLEGSARRNFKKAGRKGYRFERIDFNDHLEDIRAIWQSTDVRQGRVPEHILKGQVKPSTNPVSKTPTHDYPYFGVLKDDTLVAYAGCLVAGELCAIEQIYGHADYHADAVVPMAVIGAGRYLFEHFPPVRFYTYDNLLGATINMRRFKRKFAFTPHKVKWVLG